MYTVLACYQHSRYHPYDLTKHPVWDENRNKWVGDGFTCNDFSKEAIGFFDKIGIKSYQAIGIDKKSGVAHSWVKIDIFGGLYDFEPQTLLFFSSYDNYVNIIVVKNDD
jgi:hypothetical protein